MFHKIKDVVPNPDFSLNVQFVDGTTKLYDLRPLIERIPDFAALENPRLFEAVTVDVGGYGIIWDDYLDLSCDELWDHGASVETPFDGLMSFSDATELWGLSESALRKAVSYGKIVAGIDARKYGKQWIVSKDAMLREYGAPKDPHM